MLRWKATDAHKKSDDSGNTNITVLLKPIIENTVIDRIKRHLNWTSTDLMKEKKKSEVGIFINLRKAFEIVIRKALIKKLDNQRNRFGLVQR